MNLHYTAEFKRGLKSLPKKLQEKTAKKLEFLEKNPRHPSLRIKKIKSAKGIWEGSIDKKYRFTFERGKDTIILRVIGPHNEVLKHP